MVRTLGIEEELLLVDPTSREVVPGAPRVLKEFREHGRGRWGAGPATDEIDQELFRHQLETRTDPTTDLGDAFAQLVTARRTAGEAARAADLATVACGCVPLGGAHPVVTANDRYRAMGHVFGQVAREGGTCGMHVHVGIESPEEGVGVLDRIRPWLPVLLALSANSPFGDGRDTGYASWRTQVWSRWPSAGVTEAFGSLARYREVCAGLIATGVARDLGMLYFDARLSAAHPTVETRICDVTTDAGEAIVIAALVRGLVETAAADWAAGAAAPAYRAELLRAATWRAARYGVANSLVHPVTRELSPAVEVVAALVDWVAPALEEAGDLQRVQEGIGPAIQANGASRQRAAFERTRSVAGVVDDLIARTEASWDAQDRD
jgi:glutamate---cysteine ligase / carboxylate-amine ligase